MYSAYIKNLFQSVQASWFKVSLAFLMLYIVSVKDMSFQFSLNNSQAIAAEYIPKDEAKAKPVVYKTEKVKPKAKAVAKKIETNQFSIWDILPFGKKKSKKKNKPSRTKDSDDIVIEEANDFSNLGFLLDPVYAKNHGIDRDKAEDKSKRCQNYLRRFAPVAIAEMKKFGIPASITLAQALLESNAGESRLTKKSSNHFGIKCFSKKCGKGHCTNFMDDGHKDFFRNYENSWDSFRDHSLFLGKKRYAHLKNLGSDNYIGWARGLKKAGYATDKNYAKKLITIIEAFKLYELDD